MVFYSIRLARSLICCYSTGCFSSTLDDDSMDNTTGFYSLELSLVIYPPPPLQRIHFNIVYQGQAYNTHSKIVFSPSALALEAILAFLLDSL